MCDTQAVRHNGSTFFAKNSDRESSEPQLITRHESVVADPKKNLKTTYLTIPQVPDRYGLILSRPSWIWGAEIGLNTQGVVIGNEAVFTRLVEKKGQALLGMDLVRLGLERGTTAQEALTTMTRLLEKYGQAGPAGYRDKSFRYDNSFIIADAHEIWVLETAGRCWVAKKIKHFSAISNVLTIGSDYDLASAGLEDFARKNGYYNGKGYFHFANTFNTRFMPFMGRARERRSLSLGSMKKCSQGHALSLSNMASSLRRHYHEHSGFARHSNRDVCMHGGGLTRPSQTCGSMVAALNENQAPQIMVTGTSAPCLSLFKPVDFTAEGCLSVEHRPDTPIEQGVWQQFEWVHRRALKDPLFRQELMASRDQLEHKLQAVYDLTLSIADANQMAKQWHQSWFSKAQEAAPEYSQFKAYDRYWKKLNRLDGIVWD